MSLIIFLYTLGGANGIKVLSLFKYIGSLEYTISIRSLRISLPATYILKGFKNSTDSGSCDITVPLIARQSTGLNFMS